VALPSDEYANYVERLKEQSLKNGANFLEIGLYTASQCFFELCTPRQHSSPDSERDQQTNKQNKHHIFAPTAGAHCTIFPKLCMMIELVMPIKKVVIHFSI